MGKKLYFGTDGIRGRVGESLINPEFVLKLGWAVGKVLANGSRKKVLIGKDTRISGYLLESALEAGLSAAGVDIHLLGPMPTPAIAYLTRTLGAQAGIVISASHNPYYDNGIKFFNAAGEKLPDEIELAIEAQLQEPLKMVESKYLGKAVRINDAPGRYIEFCKSTVPPKTRLSNLKVAIDCANGASYHVAAHVFRELGAEVIATSIEPDGFNINADCGSTNPSALQKLVKEKQIDVGIALDGDGDRVILVDHLGEVVDGDEILYIIAQHQLCNEMISGGVVGTVMTNMGIELAIRQLGLDFVRTKVGDRYVIDELHNRQWSLGGESSGHIVCLDKATAGDGIITALQVLDAMLTQRKSLHEIKSGIEKFPQKCINIQSRSPATVVNHLAIQEAVREIELQLKEEGRIVLRPSGTEPLVRLMVEGRDKKQVETYASNLAAVVQKIASE